MPALWQASQRPMYVKTVWVDGFRHAILSYDDPHYLKLKANKRRPYSSVSVFNKLPKTESRLSNRNENLEDCLRNFNIAVDKKRFSLTNKQRPKSSKEFQIEELNLTNVDNDSEDDDCPLKATPQLLNEFDSSRTNYQNCNMRNFKTNKTSRVEVKDNTELSERVLQWLDLAGKVDLLAPENADRMARPRHSWPEIQRKGHSLAKSKTATDIRGKDSAKAYTPKCDSGKAQQNETIDRHDFYVPTSANTIENYARQSRNIKYTLQIETNEKTKDNPHKVKGKESRLNVVEARHKVITERNAIEKQYAELIGKKFIPDLNMGSKKQVHIFMPDLPKKFHSNTTSRTESLLTQKY